MMDMTTFLTPQPIGIFSLPAGYLLLPDGPAGTAVQSQLLQGLIPADLPPELAYYGLALAGDTDAAHAALAGDTSLVGRYNRFVLQSDLETYAGLRADLPSDLRLLLDVVAFTLGYLEEPPVADTAVPEINGLALMAQASYHLEQGQPTAALPFIEQAIAVTQPTSPLLAAQFTGTLAETRQAVNGSSYEIVPLYQQALKLLEPTALHEQKAELWLHLGITYQEMSAGRRNGLAEAVKCYQAALHTFKKESHPEHFALCQTNLALAYLTMPMREASDQLRMGIAVQSLREALEIYRPHSHPEQWASVQLNLANALQYLPSSHPAENLAQAVELYEEILSVRTAVGDPVGYARVLANQANALAHLGIFNHAQQKFQQALTIFELYGEAEAAVSVRSALEQMIGHRETAVNGENGTARTPTV